MMKFEKHGAKLLKSQQKLSAEKILRVLIKLQKTFIRSPELVELEFGPCFLKLFCFDGPLQ